VNSSISLPVRSLVVARWAVAAVFFLNGFAIANWVVRIPAVSAALNLSTGSLGLVLLAAAVGALVSMPVVGQLCSRFGSKQLTLFCSLGFALLTMLLALASSVVLLVLALFFWGALNAGLDVAMNTQGTTVERGFGRPVLSGFHAFWSVGSLFGAAVGGVFARFDVVAGVHLGIVGGLVLVAFFVVSRFLVLDVQDSDSEVKSGLKLSVGLWALGAIAFCALLGEGAIADWGALYLKNSLGADAGLAAAGFAAFQMCMAAFRFAGDGLRLRFGDARVVLLSGVVAMFGMALAIVFDQIWVVILGFGFVGAGFAVIFPAALGLVSKLESGSSGPAIAWVGGVGYSGFLVGPPLIGLLSEFVSLRFGLLAVLLAGVAIAGLSKLVRVA
jgi:MFS family permease